MRQPIWLHGEVSGTAEDHGLDFPDVELECIFRRPIKHSLRILLHDCNASVYFGRGKMIIAF